MSVKVEPKVRRRRIRALNVEGGDASDLTPLTACDCDNHCGTHTTVCVGDVDADVDVDACGVWG